MEDHEEKVKDFLCCIAKVCKAVAAAITYQVDGNNDPGETDKLINELPHCFHEVYTNFDYIREHEDLENVRYPEERSAAICLMFDLIDYLSVLQTKLKRSTEKDKNNNTWVLSCDLMDPTAFEFCINGKKMKPYVYIEEHVGEETMKAILPYASEDLHRAVVSLAKKLILRYNLQLTDPVGGIKEAVDTVCNKLCSGCSYSLTIPEEIDTYNENQAANNISSFPLKYSKESIATLVKKHLILRVPTWSGEWVYPAFQFDKHIAEIITELLPKIPVDKNQNGNNSQWPVTLYLYQALKKNDKPLSSLEIQDHLKEANQWKPDWKTKFTPEETDRIERGVTAAKLKTLSPRDELNLFRVTRNKRSPYFHDHLNPKDNNDTKGRGGRLSPSYSDVGTDVGACYFADSADGTWAESLASRLTLSLEDVLGRVFFHIKVKWVKEVKLITLITSTAGKGAVSERHPVSQKLANMLLDKYPYTIGVQYPLKTSGFGHNGASYTGYAIWGPKGAQNPTSLKHDNAWTITNDSDSSRGIWTGDQDAISALHDDSNLVDYLKRREDDFKYYPIALWRFPPPPKN